MGEKETKIKIIKCRVCGKEYNKYTRPRGSYGANTCSEECEEALKGGFEPKSLFWGEGTIKETLTKLKSPKTKLQIWLIISLITEVIGTLIGLGYGILGALLGFAIGFIAPTILYIICVIM
ncbi:MAG: hypothetical protein ACFFC3_04460 [Candidatus Odinarchaeota archaeon]